MILPSTQLSSNENVFARDFDGEIVLLDLDAGVYYGLDAIASRAWRELCDGRQSLAETVSKMHSSYDVDEPTLMRDLSHLASEWLAKGLVSVRA
jgi:hypothetical protein